ncbi:hypothetical protein ABH15_09985 [Methanoculleus taiwanensis]|uniref:Uncharacterized protein n=1 Tax=Methanoculleus taiwanensis TaxID=1550565 RepID=A0A498H389_9EURY|nr:hypothetical protein [Methanoculleus taiwanensis]RXE56404.1 hypothetical protein ABH15_09985 [Methanoculleus taiwanensis]
MVDLTCFAKLFCSEMQEVRKGLVRLIESAGDGVKILGLIYKTQFTKEIEADLYLNQWDNFLVGKLKPILKNNLSVDSAAMVRIHICLGTAAKLVYYINGRSAYLNSAQELSAECGYVFDVPMNPGDTLNYALSFDDSVFTEITVKFVRLQEVR